MEKKYKVGRPLLFETPEDLKKAIEDYLNSTAIEEWTLTGLCMAMGTSRDVLDDYKERGQGYKEIIKSAKMMIENSYELSLRKSGRTGDIFALKNFGWVDKMEVEQRNINYNKDVSDMSDEELMKIMKT